MAKQDIYSSLRFIAGGASVSFAEMRSASGSAGTRRGVATGPPTHATAEVLLFRPDAHCAGPSKMMTMVMIKSDCTSSIHGRSIPHSHHAPCMLNPASTWIRMPVMLEFFASIIYAATQSSNKVSRLSTAPSLSFTSRSGEYLSPWGIVSAFNRELAFRNAHPFGQQQAGQNGIDAYPGPDSHGKTLDELDLGRLCDCIRHAASSLAVGLWRMLVSAICCRLYMAYRNASRSNQVATIRIGLECRPRLGE